ncbi:hypothetical protein FXO38_02699, partial [Capsicum annuum]
MSLTLVREIVISFNVDLWFTLYGNIGVHYDTRNLGVLSPVTLSSLNVGSRDLAKKRSYKVGLKGESLSLHTLSGSSSVDWVQGSLVAQKTTPDLVQ